VRLIDQLLRFTPDRSPGHRIRVRGVVTLQQPDGNLYIMDETGGLYVQTKQQTIVQPGDTVDVVGFAATGRYSPILEDAFYHTVATGPPPAPHRIAQDSLLEGRYDSRLVRAEGV